jgi:hypothetical protein
VVNLALSEVEGEETLESKLLRFQREVQAMASLVHLAGNRQ